MNKKSDDVCFSVSAFVHPGKEMKKLRGMGVSELQETCPFFYLFIPLLLLPHFALPSAATFFVQKYLVLLLPLLPRLFPNAPASMSLLNVKFTFPEDERSNISDEFIQGPVAIRFPDPTKDNLNSLQALIFIQAKSYSCLVSEEKTL